LIVMLDPAHLEHKRQMWWKVRHIKRDPPILIRWRRRYPRRDQIQFVIRILLLLPTRRNRHAYAPRLPHMRRRPRHGGVSHRRGRMIRHLTCRRLSGRWRLVPRLARRQHPQRYPEYRRRENNDPPSHTSSLGAEAGSLQLDRPVSRVEELLPTLVPLVRQADVDHRTALRLHGLRDQVHV